MRIRIGDVPGSGGAGGAQGSSTMPTLAAPPASPTLGQSYIDSTTGGVFTYTNLGTGSQWIQVGGATLTPTGIVQRVAATVSTNITLTSNVHTPVNAAGGVVTVTLPSGQAEGTTISVEKEDATTNVVNVTGTIRANAGATLPLVLQYESITFIADSAGAWWPRAGHKTKASLDALYAGLGVANTFTDTNVIATPTGASRFMFEVRSPGGGQNSNFAVHSGGTTWVSALNATYQVQLSYAGGRNNSINGSAIGGIGLAVFPSSAADKGLVVRGLASQAGNPFEVQNSSGSTLAWVDSSGSITTNGSLRGNFISDTNYTVVLGQTYSAGGSTTTGLRLSSASSLSWTSTGNITQSVDTALVRSAAGVLKVTNGSTGGGGLQTGAFATASRPSASAYGVGTQIYDSTLSKPIWSDGTTWRDATGTAV